VVILLLFAGEQISDLAVPQFGIVIDIAIGSFGVRSTPKPMPIVIPIPTKNDCGTLEKT
jgi:hypothetical protein